MVEEIADALPALNTDDQSTPAITAETTPDTTTEKIAEMTAATIDDTTTADTTDVMPDETTAETAAAIDDAAPAETVATDEVSTTREFGLKLLEARQCQRQNLQRALREEPSRFLSQTNTAIDRDSQ